MSATRLAAGTATIRPDYIRSGARLAVIVTVLAWASAFVASARSARNTRLAPSRWAACPSARSRSVVSAAQPSLGRP